MVFMTLASALALAIGFGLMTSAPEHGAFGWICSGSIALLGVGGAIMTLARLLARIRYPSLPRVARQSARN